MCVKWCRSREVEVGRVVWLIVWVGQFQRVLGDHFLEGMEKEVVENYIDSIDYYKGKE